MTTDLIAPDSFGKKSFTREALEVRLEEEGKQGMMDTYGRVLELRDFGIVLYSCFRNWLYPY